MLTVVEEIQSLEKGIYKCFMKDILSFDSNASSYPRTVGIGELVYLSI